MNNNELKDFWQLLHSRYPEIMKHFGKWIDDYKSEIKWNDLFLEGVKFHHLPVEFVQGVVIRYQKESAVYHAENEADVGHFFSFIGELECLFDNEDERRCRVCGCTDVDCSQCIAKTGHPCHWVEDDLCSACIEPKSKLILP